MSAKTPKPWTAAQDRGSRESRGVHGAASAAPSGPGFPGNNASALVYVLETGSYDSRDIEGVYATAEAAMNAWSPDKSRQERYASLTQPKREFSYRWSGPNADGIYRFDADWDDAAMIFPYEVQS